MNSATKLSSEYGFFPKKEFLISFVGICELIVISNRHPDPDFTNKGKPIRDS